MLTAILSNWLVQLGTPERELSIKVTATIYGCDLHAIYTYTRCVVLDSRFDGIRLKITRNGKQLFHICSILYLPQPFHLFEADKSHE